MERVVGKMQHMHWGKKRTWWENLIICATWMPNRERDKKAGGFSGDSKQFSKINGRHQSTDGDAW